MLARNRHAAGFYVSTLIAFLTTSIGPTHKSNGSLPMRFDASFYRLLRSAQTSTLKVAKDLLVALGTDAPGRWWFLLNVGEDSSTYVIFSVVLVRIRHPCFSGFPVGELFKMHMDCVCIECRSSCSDLISSNSMKDITHWTACSRFV